MQTCADAVALRAPVAPPSDPEIRRRVGEVRAQIARANALRVTAQFEQGIVAAKAALDDAERLSYLPLIAEGRQTLGDLYGDHGDFAESSRSFRGASASTPRVRIGARSGR